VKPYSWPPQVPPEELGDPAVIMVHGSQPWRIGVEIVRASPEQRADPPPFIRFLRTLRRPPDSERISILEQRRQRPRAPQEETG